MSVWIDRALEARIRSLVLQRPVLALTGSRQTGKTSLLRHLYPDYKYVSLDLPSEAEAAEKDSQAFLSRHGEPLIIDEVQYAPMLFRHLKIAVDSNRRKYGRYLLTGSQKFSFLRDLSESLAGRIEIVELETLSADEILRHGSRLSIEEMIVRGGFPELHENSELDSSSFYRSYISTYLERDVRQILNVSNLRDFERFLRACALRSAQMLNKAELARDVGIHPTTANDWLSVLQASNQLVLMEPWFTNRTKSLTKTPKLYLADTGLLCSLMNINSASELIASPLRGAIWETYVFSELRKRQVATQGHWAIHYWRERNSEIDFLIDRGGRFDLFEAKWAATPDASSAAAFNVFSEKAYGKNIASRSIVCRTPNSYPLTPNTLALGIKDLSLSAPTSGPTAGAGHRTIP